jgi:hypothetical protein
MGSRAIEIETADDDAFCERVKGREEVELLSSGMLTGGSDGSAEWTGMELSAAAVGVEVGGMSDVISEGSEMCDVGVDDKGRARDGGEADTMDNGGS